MSDTDERLWEVVESGLDYPNRAVAETSGRDEELKYAGLHLYAAIEDDREGPTGARALGVHGR